MPRLLSQTCLYIIIILILNSCEHFEQENADVDFKGDKFYGKGFDNGIKYNEEQLYPASVIAYPGQTLKQVAEDNEVEVLDLMAINRIPDAAYEFQDAKRIVLPNYVLHRVRNGQTVYMLARKYKVNPKSIIETNNIPEPFQLVIDQVVKVHIERIGIDKEVNQTTTAKNLSFEPQYQVETNPTSKPKHNLYNLPKEEDREAPPVQVEFKEIKKEGKNVNIPKIVRAEKTNEKFVWPVKGKVINGFGNQPDGTKNDGVIVAAPHGTAIKAIDNGLVVYAGDDIVDFGHMVIIKHSNNMYSTYAHQSKIMVHKGDEVRKGQVIGKVGASGTVSFPQLYFSIRKGKKVLDPIRLIKR
ncbi:MAG: M23 family metallopeptidase [Sphingobacteriia bacterium]|nr:M23 family metallopeptidase [Sphingobacteriia bacterium]